MTEPVTALSRFLERLPSIRVSRHAYFAQAKHTRKASRVDWDNFVAWCTLHGCVPMPTTPQTIVASLEHPASGGAPLRASVHQGRWSGRAMVARSVCHGTRWQECAAASGGR